MSKAKSIWRWIYTWLVMSVVVMDEAGGAGGEGGGAGGGGAGGGGGDAAVTPEAARTFLKDYVVEGVDLATLPDDKVVAWHGKIKPIADRGTGDWAPDWRQKMAKGDDKALKQLERYASPLDVWTKARALEQRMTSGELRSTLPKDATEDQIKVWRTENGIPEAPDKYALTLKEGLVIGEADKPVIEGFLKHVHGANYTNAQASAAAEWYFAHKEQQAAAQAEADTKFMQQCEDELRGEFGAEYRKNINLVQGVLNLFPAEAAAALMNGRLGNGKPFMNDPQIVRGFLDLAKIVNPTGSLMGGTDGEGLAKSVDDEIADIEKLMREKNAEYVKDEKKQARLRDLYTARDQIKQRNAAGSK